METSSSSGASSPCARGCGCLGSPETLNMCSVCFKHLLATLAAAVASAYEKAVEESPVAGAADEKAVEEAAVAGADDEKPAVEEPSVAGADDKKPTVEETAVAEVDDEKPAVEEVVVAGAGDEKPAAEETAAAGADDENPAMEETAVAGADEEKPATQQDEHAATMKRLEEWLAAFTPAELSYIRKREAERVRKQKEKENAYLADKCRFCFKKLRIVGWFTCRCGRNYCTKHRHPEDHNCMFDYQRAGVLTLIRNNPLVIADKLRDRI